MALPLAVLRNDLHRDLGAGLHRHWRLPIAGHRVVGRHPALVMGAAGQRLLGWPKHRTSRVHPVDHRPRLLDLVWCARRNLSSCDQTVTSIGFRRSFRRALVGQPTGQSTRASSKCRSAMTATRRSGTWCSCVHRGSEVDSSPDDLLTTHRVHDFGAAGKAPLRSSPPTIRRGQLRQP